MSQSNRNYLKSVLKALWFRMDAARADDDFDTVHSLQREEQRIEALLVA